MTEIRNLVEQSTLDYDNYIVVQKPDGTTRRMSLYTLLGVTPPNSNVLLQLDFEGANNSTTFIDSSPYNRIITAFGSAKLSTTAPITGSSSAVFDGSGSYLSIPSSSDFDFGSGDFTISQKIKTTQASSYRALLSRRDAATFGAGAWVIYNFNGTIQVWCGGYSVSAPMLTANISTANDGSAHEIEWNRVGNLFTLKIDSNVVDTVTSSISIAPITAPVLVARDPNSGIYDYAGATDSVIITKP